MAPSLLVDCWLLTVEGGVKKMKIARIICWLRDSTLRPTFGARIWYHSGLTAGIDIISCDIMFDWLSPITNSQSLPHIVSGCITIIKSSQQLTLNHWVFPPLLLQSTVNSQQSTVNNSRRCNRNWYHLRLGNWNICFRGGFDDNLRLKQIISTPLAEEL